MLVNASASPGPAMWQGVIFIALCFLWLYIYPSAVRGKEKFIFKFVFATAALLVLGIFLMVAILKMG